jgi:hypothetical protein
MFDLWDVRISCWWLKSTVLGDKRGTNILEETASIFSVEALKSMSSKKYFKSKKDEIIKYVGS